MLQAGGLDFCLVILQNLLDHWKKVIPEDVSILQDKLEIVCHEVRKKQ